MQTRIALSNIDGNNNIETPTKKVKRPADLNTADSTGLTEQKPSSLNQIDAQ